MRKLTDKQKKKYLEDPCHCPFCGHNGVRSSYIEPDDEDLKRAYESISCGKCFEQWHDIYTLTDVSEGEYTLDELLKGGGDLK